ncbi:sensor histidine kinase [Pengzhenrongella frigida]|uniref:sensor histidine kinase n=1 Tax=Pengzhenrongella frigida TaxID=1259133 RepID=UPI0013ED865A|nr:histidine kinase [Cellulomonas sp. HLT2-17]
MTASSRRRPWKVDDDGGVAVLPWFVGPDGPGRGRLVANVALSAAVPVLALIDVAQKELPVGAAAGVVGLSLIVGAAVYVRTRWPVALLALALGAVIVTVLADVLSPPLVAASGIAVFTVACVRPRRVSAPSALVAALVLFGAAGARTPGPMTEPRMLIVLVWTALAFALGVAVRTQLAYVDALAERARRAEDTREQEARARIAEERLRIARELHDVVAHHIAVINVHAGLARRAAGRDAAVVDTSLAHVQTAASTVLAELGAVLQVLRSNDPLEPGTEPAPGLDRLDALLATFAATGFTVRTRATGRPQPLDGACDLAAFRIVQESLTNASKHGAGARADLSLTYGADALTLAVGNPVASASAPAPGTLVAPGHGLIGMRERAASCGGSLSAAPDGHGAFRMTAVIPYRPTAAVPTAAAPTGAVPPAAVGAP